MSRIIDIDKAWKQLNIDAINHAIIWSLNAPRCLDTPCFQNWLNGGRQLVKTGFISDAHYRKRVKEEIIHRKNRKAARRHKKLV